MDVGVEGWKDERQNWRRREAEEKRRQEEERKRTEERKRKKEEEEEEKRKKEQRMREEEKEKEEEERRKEMKRAEERKRKKAKEEEEKEKEEEEKRRKEEMRREGEKRRMEEKEEIEKRRRDKLRREEERKTEEERRKTEEMKREEENRRKKEDEDEEEERRNEQRMKEEEWKREKEEEESRRREEEKQRKKMEETKAEEERRKRIMEEQERKRRMEAERQRRWEEERRKRMKQQKKAEERRWMNGVEEEEKREDKGQQKGREDGGGGTKSWRTNGAATVYYTLTSTNSTPAERGRERAGSEREGAGAEGEGAGPGRIRGITTPAPPLVGATMESEQRLVTQAEPPPTRATKAKTTTAEERKKESPAAGLGSTSANSSTCPPVLALCEQDESCRWHLSELRVRCALGRRCTRSRSQQRCAPALHRFVRFVHGPLAEALQFCDCADDDAECRRKMLSIGDGNGCEEGSQSQRVWTCTQTVQMCRTEAECSRHLSSIRSACPLSSALSNSPSSSSSSASSCAAPSLSACRSALTAARGSWLDEPCHCPPDDISCAELAEGMWPRHPCIEPARREFNEQFSNGQIVLENSKRTTTKTTIGGKRVLIRVGGMGSEGAMELGDEVTVVPEVGEGGRKGKNKNRIAEEDEKEEKSEENQKKDVEEPEVHIERKMNGGGTGGKNGRKEVYEWAENEEARKMDEEKEAKRRMKEGKEGKMKEEEEVKRKMKKTEEDQGKKNKKKEEEEGKKTEDQAKDEEAKERKEGEERKKMTEEDEEKMGKQMGDQTKDEKEEKLPRPRVEKHRRPLPLTLTENQKEFVTQKPPIEGDGCQTRNVDGEWISHYRNSVFRHYHDWAGRCSSWCECSGNGTLECHELGCMTDVLCETRNTVVAFGQRLYLEDRGACQCHDGRFICDTSELMPDLGPGLYISLGYSKPELDLIREVVPKTVRERSGLISQSRSLAKDLATRLQFALERVLPTDTKCRVAVLEHYAQEAVVLLQLQWFGSEPMATDTKDTNKNNNNQSKPSWHSGKMEKICSPFARELENNFLLEHADRYQLLLSTIKQLRVLDLLDGLPSGASSSPSSPSSSSSSSFSFHGLLFLPLFLIVLFPHSRHAILR